LRLAPKHATNLRVFNSAVFPFPIPGIAQAVSSCSCSRPKHSVSWVNPNLRAERAAKLDGYLSTTEPFGVITVGYFTESGGNPSSTQCCRFKLPTPSTRSTARHIKVTQAFKPQRLIKGFEDAYCNTHLPARRFGVWVSRKTTAQGSALPWAHFIRTDSSRLVRNAPHVLNIRDTLWTAALFLCAWELS